MTRAPHPPLEVVFLNENTLGHGSYLPRFIEELERRPELGIHPIRIDAVPLPPRLQRRADFSIRGLRRFGMDFHIARWRRVVSAHARARIEALRSRQRIDAVVVNTQSVALDLTALCRSVPIAVCLDATFAQLRRTPWFSPNRIAGWFSPVSLAPILGRERRLFRAVRILLPWSRNAAASLASDYGIRQDRILTLPPSLDLGKFQPAPKPSGKPRLLFVGGNFQRKGGPLVLEAFRRLADRCELHVVTQSDVPAAPGVFIHRDVTAGSGAWLQRWREAAVFVFPSALETYGIVLLEALAFMAPVVSSRAGAAADILDEGRCGLLLDSLTPDALTRAIENTLDDPQAANERARRGRLRVEQLHDLSRNAERLAETLRRLTRGA